MRQRMDIFGGAERLMGMSDEVWLRHANPWSGWSRMLTAIPLLILAIWSRVWLGWWALVPVAAALVWIWVNPRAFPPPRDFGAWVSRGVLGERLYLARDRHDIAAHHLRAASVLAMVSAVGAPFLVWGLVVLDPWLTAFGALLTAGPKIWFVDRMVWLHADLTGTIPGTPLPDPTLPEPTGGPT